MPAAARCSFDFSGHRVLVTGGSSGIGLACVRAFHAAGAVVIATGRTREEIESAREAVSTAAVDFRILDVRDRAQVDALVAGLGALDALVLCAGTIRRMAEHDPDVFDEVLDVNLSGGMRVASAARPLLARDGGSIVFIGSVMSFFGGPAQPGYSASKGGVRNLTMSLAAAYAADDIRVNAVAPGWVLTELSRGARENPERNAVILGRTPIGRWADPAEIADPVLFLCSDAARYMTGTVMPVDGGYTSFG